MSPKARALLFSLAFSMGIGGCTRHQSSDPVEIFSTTRDITALHSEVFTRTLARGAYLIEVRERDIDVRTTVSVGKRVSTVEARLPRRGITYEVVSVDVPTELRIEIASTDVGDKRGQADLRVSRWSRPVEEEGSRLEAGYAAQSAAAGFTAQATVESWARASAKLSEAIDGRELRGEGVLGLTYQFLANGSNTVVASLWPVDDALTARFMEEFYLAYRTTGRPSDALRAAQLRTRGTAAASVWASFVVRANALP